MTALALLGTLSLAAGDLIAGDALAPYRGQPVLSVDVDAPADENVEELRSLVDIHPGYLLSTDAIQAAIKRLYALGRFSDVGVAAERLSGTVSLHFYARAIRRLEDLEIEGIDQSDETAVRAALDLGPGDEVDSRTASILRHRAVNYLQRAGFPHAEVDVEQMSVPGEAEVSFRVLVREGEPTRVAKVRFMGRPRVHPDILRRLVGTRQGGILDMATVEDDVDVLLGAFRSRGFFEARVDPPQIETKSAGAVVSFPITAGDRFHIEIYGNRRLTQKDLLELWPASLGEPSQTDLAIFTQRIEDAYQRLGHLEAQVDIRTVREPATELTRHLVHVREGSPYRVVSLEFVGSREFSPELLRAQVQSLLSRELESDGFLDRVRPADSCLADPPGLSHPSEPARGCERPGVPAEQRWVPSLIEDALEGIAAAYQNRGYLSARVGPPETTFDDTNIAVSIPVVEGPQARIHSISFRGNEELSAGELLAAVEDASDTGDGSVAQRPGEPYSASGIEDARIEILRRYRDRGYLYASAFAKAHISKDGKRADMVFTVEEGPQVRIERILVRGNRFTRDGLIRSRIAMKPGDLYRLDQALADQRSIAALGVFSSVRVRIIDEEKPAERKDVVAEVVERPRSAVELRYGLSTADGVRVGVGYSHQNVLGTASRFHASANINRQLFFDLYGGNYGDTMLDRYKTFSVIDQIEREVRVGLQSPRLKRVVFDPLARIDLVHERENAISFSLDSVTGILGVDFAPTENINFSIGPEVTYTNLDCIIAGGGAVLGEDACVEEVQGSPAHIDAGTRISVSVTPTLTLDYRDNRFDPTRGYYFSVKSEYATGRRRTPEEKEGVTRFRESDFSFAKLEGVLSGYLPAGGSVLAASMRGGIIYRLHGIDVPIDERFFLGGRATLRGFAEGETLIPEDACVYLVDELNPCPGVPEAKRVSRTASAPPLSPGGQSYVLFKVEARVPLRAFSENLSIALFLDFGNLWIGRPRLDELNFRTGVGAGIRYATPVGPLALDVGFNTNPRAISGEASNVFHFNVGVF